MTGALDRPDEVLGPFRARLVQDASRLARLRDGLAGSGGPALVDDPRRVELEQLAHRLVGAGATFGCVEITLAAEDVERLTTLRPALVASADAECRRLLLLAVERLHVAVAEASTSGRH